MNKKFLSVICIIIFVLCVCFTGCTNKEVVNDYNEYNRLYVEVVNVAIPKGSDTEMLYKLKDEDVIKKLEQMNEIVNRINGAASGKKEKHMLSNVLLFEEDIDFLIYAVDNENNLTGDEKLKRTSAIIHVEMNRNDIEEGNVIH